MELALDKHLKPTIPCKQKDIEETESESSSFSDIVTSSSPGNVTLAEDGSDISTFLPPSITATEASRAASWKKGLDVLERRQKERGIPDTSASLFTDASTCFAPTVLSKISDRSYASATLPGGDEQTTGIKPEQNTLFDQLVANFSHLGEKLGISTSSSTPSEEGDENEERKILPVRLMKNNACNATDVPGGSFDMIAFHNLHSLPTDSSLSVTSDSNSFAKGDCIGWHEFSTPSDIKKKFQKYVDYPKASIDLSSQGPTQKGIDAMNNRKKSTYFRLPTVPRRFVERIKAKIVKMKRKSILLPERAASSEDIESTEEKRMKTKKYGSILLTRMRKLKISLSKGGGESAKSAKTLSKECDALVQTTDQCLPMDANNEAISSQVLTTPTNRPSNIRNFFSVLSNAVRKQSLNKFTLPIPAALKRGHDREHTSEARTREEASASLAMQVKNTKAEQISMKCRAMKLLRKSKEKLTSQQSAVNEIEEIEHWSKVGATEPDLLSNESTLVIPEPIDDLLHEEVSEKGSILGNEGSEKEQVPEANVAETQQVIESQISNDKGKKEDETGAQEGMLDEIKQSVEKDAVLAEEKKAETSIMGTNKMDFDNSGGIFKWLVPATFGKANDDNCLSQGWVRGCGASAKSHGSATSESSLSTWVDGYGRHRKGSKPVPIIADELIDDPHGGFSTDDTRKSSPGAILNQVLSFTCHNACDGSDRPGLNLLESMSSVTGTFVDDDSGVSSAAMVQSKPQLPVKYHHGKKNGTVSSKSEKSLNKTNKAKEFGNNANLAEKKWRNARHVVKNVKNF